MKQLWSWNDWSPPVLSKKVLKEVRDKEFESECRKEQDFCCGKLRWKVRDSRSSALWSLGFFFSARLDVWKILRKWVCVSDWRALLHWKKCLICWVWVQVWKGSCMYEWWYHRRRTERKLSTWGRKSDKILPSNFDINIEIAVTCLKNYKDP